MNILISGIGGPTPRSIARRLREIYPNFKLVGVDANPRALGFYIKGLVDICLVVPRASDPNYWEIMKELIQKHQIDFAFIQPEFEVTKWGEYFKLYGNFPCETLIPPLEHVNLLMNKARMADFLVGTEFIPKTIILTRENGNLCNVENQIGFPCWIRASVGSGGLGSLKINSKKELDAWLFIHNDVPEFTVSEFLSGRHLANQMLYLNGVFIKNAGLQCSEYVMADIAPSKVTGNTSFGKFVNEDKMLAFCENVMDYIQNKTGVPAHAVYSFDLKEDSEGNLKVTEINIRHMAYTGIMAKVGFDLVDDTIKIFTNRIGDIEMGRFNYDRDYIFLRDVDENPIILCEKDLLSK